MVMQCLSILVHAIALSPYGPGARKRGTERGTWKDERGAKEGEQLRVAPSPTARQCKARKQSTFSPLCLHLHTLFLSVCEVRRLQDSAAPVPHNATFLGVSE